MNQKTLSGRYVRIGSDASDSRSRTGTESFDSSPERISRGSALPEMSYSSLRSYGSALDLAATPQETTEVDPAPLDCKSLVSEIERGSGGAVVSTSDIAGPAAARHSLGEVGSSSDVPASDSSWLSFRGFFSSVRGFVGKNLPKRTSIVSETRARHPEHQRSGSSTGQRHRSRSVDDATYPPAFERSGSGSLAAPIGTSAGGDTDLRGRLSTAPESGRSLLHRLTQPLRKPSPDSSRRDLLLEFGTAEVDQAGFQVITRMRERSAGDSRKPQQGVEFLIKNLDTGEERYLTEQEVAQMTSADTVQQLMRRQRSVMQRRDPHQDDPTGASSGTKSRRSRTFSSTPLGRIRAFSLLPRAKTAPTHASPSISSTQAAALQHSKSAATRTRQDGAMLNTQRVQAGADSLTSLTSTAGAAAETPLVGDGKAFGSVGDDTVEDFRSPAGSLDRGLLTKAAAPATASTATQRAITEDTTVLGRPRFLFKFPEKGSALNKREYQRLLREFRVAQRFVRVHAPNKSRGANTTANMCLVQCFRPHTGPVWSMEFSADGRYLATGGQDAVIMVWKVQNEPHTLNYSNADLLEIASWLRSPATAGARAFQRLLTPPPESSDGAAVTVDDGPERLYARCLFEVREPHRVFRGHGGDVLCVAWSANNFLLSSSMDKTVRLWHVDYNQVLRKFLHADFVTCVAFHPRNENFFLSGSLDERIRLWNISSRHVSDYAEVRGLVTACGFTPNGEQALVGTYRGECKVYNVVRFEEGERALQYITTLEVHSRRGRNSKGSKITSFAMMPTPDRGPGRGTNSGSGSTAPAVSTTSNVFVPGQNAGNESAATMAPSAHSSSNTGSSSSSSSNSSQHYEVLISTNDSRIRLYRVQDLRIVSKFVGHSCTWNHIRASFSDDFRYVITASEDRLVYIWNTVLYEQAGHHSAPGCALHLSQWSKGTPRLRDAGGGTAAAAHEMAPEASAALASNPQTRHSGPITNTNNPSSTTNAARTEQQYYPDRMLSERASASALTSSPSSSAAAGTSRDGTSSSQLPRIRRYRNDRFEAFMPFGEAHVTAAVFAPQRSTNRLDVIERSPSTSIYPTRAKIAPAPVTAAAAAAATPLSSSATGTAALLRATSTSDGLVVVVAAHDGTIGVFENIPADFVPW